jgi:hypothetical protein
LSSILFTPISGPFGRTMSGFFSRARFSIVCTFLSVCGCRFGSGRAVGGEVTGCLNAFA